MTTKEKIKEYVCNGEGEDDNYQWLYVNYQFEEAN